MSPQEFSSIKCTIRPQVNEKYSTMWKNYKEMMKSGFAPQQAREAWRAVSGVAKEFEEEFLAVNKELEADFKGDSSGIIEPLPPPAG